MQRNNALFIINKYLYFSIKNQSLNNSTFLYGLLDKKPTYSDTDISLYQLAKKYDESFNQDLANIRQFLLNDDAVKRQLKKLDAALRAKLSQSPYIKQSLLSNVNAHPYKQFKLLSSYLYAWADENGFGAPATLSGFQADNDFLRLLADRRLFKDTVFGHTIHGEWTHFIQWWCIVEANKENKFLCNEPASILGWLGLQKSSKWFDTFELNRDSNAINLSYSFTPIGHSVATFTKFLISLDGQQLAPLLSPLIAMRINRRVEKILHPSI